MIDLNQLLGLGALGAGGLLTGKAYQRLGEIGEQARREAGDIATDWYRANTLYALHSNDRNRRSINYYS